MNISHTNRMGHVYYLHEGKTKTGKPRYHFSKKPDGELAQTVPKGYEVSENPNGQVFLRKIVPRDVTKEEISVVEAGVRRHSDLKVFRVDAKKDSIVVYTPNQSEDDLDRIGDELGIGGFFRARMIEALQRHSSLSASLRFVLHDKETHRFSVQRWVCRGGFEGWRYLASGDLAELTANYAPHLGKESFFDLM